MNFSEVSDTTKSLEHPQPSGHANEKGRVLKQPGIRRLQRKHFLTYTVFPGIMTVVALAALPWWKPGWLELGLGVGLWLMSGLGVTVGYHRLFTHRAFGTSPYVKGALSICGAMAAPGPLIYWVANHRRHHALSDIEGDPHSPQLSEHKGWRGMVSGLWHAHFGWMTEHDAANPRFYCKDLIRDRVLRWIDKRYLWWVSLGIILPFFIGWAVHGTLVGGAIALLWAGFFRLFFVQNVICSVNSICHYFGRRRYETKDHSYNNGLLSILTLGESWHNNHHAMQRSAMLGHSWWEIDLGGYAIRILKRLGLVWDVQMPNPNSAAASKVVRSDS